MVGRPKNKDRDLSEAMTLSVPATARKLGIGVEQTMDAIKAGQIPAIRINDRYRVPVKKLDRLLNDETAA